MNVFKSLALSTILAALLPGLSAQAQDALSGLQQTEWDAGFDAQSQVARPLNTTTPILSPTTVPAIEQAIYAYQDLVSRGGWNAVPEVEMRIGMRDPVVTELRRRLIVSGDLRQTSGDSAAFDSYVQAAVKRFQDRHGLPADGAVGAGTLKALNVPADQRLRQLEVNLERIRQMGAPEGRYIVVNIPDAKVEAVENGAVVARYTAVVGKIDRQTPLVASHVTQVRFNPTWTAPKSIVKKDLIPKVRADPEYLTRNKIRILDSAGNELPSTAIDWNTDQAVNYMFRQDAGELNSMGTMRLMFPNPHEVFMHDTPSKNVFAEAVRFESSGCVRVHNIRELATWVLRDNGYSRANLDDAIRSGQFQDVQVASPPAMFTAYFTAWTTGDGIVQFRNDIYNYDFGSNAIALNQDASQIGTPVAQ